MKFTPFSLIALLTSAFVSSADAAVIVWGAATNTTAVTNVSTNGTKIIAINGGAGTPTVNGVVFDTTGSPTGGGDSGGLLNGATTGDAGLNTLLNNVDFGGGGGLISFDLGTFTLGHQIEVQVFFTDQRVGQQDRVMRFGSSTGGGTVDLEANPNNLNSSPWGSYAIGTFVADGVDPDLTMDAQGFGNAHITALQVRDLGLIPEPGTASLALLGGIALAFRRRR